MRSKSSKRSPLFYAAALTALLLLLTVASQGVFAYFEGRPVPFFDALLFVAETLSTTGYGELLPFHSPVTVLWTLGLIGVGFLAIFVWLASQVGEWVSERFQFQPPRRAPRNLAHQVIICGAGPVAQFVARECQEAGVPAILLSHRRTDLEEASRAGLTVMEGDPRDADTLQAANIGVARALVATMSDPDNASTALVTRAIRSDLPLFCTVEHAANEHFLLAAGATRAVSAKRRLGQRLGWLAHAPIHDQLEQLLGPVAGLAFTQVPVLPGSGLTISAAQVQERTGCVILGLWQGARFVAADRIPTGPLSAGQLVMAAGLPADIARLRELGQTQHRPAPASEEVLVLGSGDVGQAAIEALEQDGVPYRVVSLHLPPDRPDWIRGDATTPDLLKQAGIAEAGRCIVALDDDARAVFATLVARQLGPSLRIIARANSLETVPRLYLAGADIVLSVSEAAGSSLARLVLPEGSLPPSLDQFGTRTVPATLAGAARKTGCVLLGVLRAGGELDVGSRPSRPLVEGDKLLFFGTQQQLAHLQES